MQRVHADLGAQRIEIGVRRHHDGLCISVMPGGAAGVAELLAAELVVAGIGNAVGGAALAQFQRGQADEGLVGRTDGIGADSGRLISGWSGDSFSMRQLSTSMPSTKRLGSNEGCDTKASTSPVSGSSATSAALPSKACSATFCRPMSMDSMMSEPGTGSMPQRAHGTSARRHLDLFQAGASMQRFFPGLLDALLADHVGAAVVAQLAGAFQVLDVAVGDAADVPPRGRPTGPADTAHPAGAQFDAGELEGMGGEPGRLGFIQVVAQLQAGVAAGLGRAARSGAGRSG